MRELAEAARTHQAGDCEALYLRAASSGDASLLTWYIRRIIALGQFRRAEELIEGRCLSGLLLGELSAAVGISGQYGESERLARRAFDVSGDRHGHRRLTHHLLSLGMHRDAARLYSWAADHGDPSAARWLVGHYEAQGDRITAERLACATLTQRVAPPPFSPWLSPGLLPEKPPTPRDCARSLLTMAMPTSSSLTHASVQTTGITPPRCASTLLLPRSSTPRPWSGCHGAVTGKATTGAQRTWHMPQRPAATATPCTASPTSDLPRAISKTPND
ncbi:hypothetical protein ACWDDN_48075 [Streptomyces griseoruber]